MGNKASIVILDADTLGENFNTLNELNQVGDLEIYPTTSPTEVSERIKNKEIILTNKVVLNETNLRNQDSVKMIGVLATGTNNIDIPYAQSKGIVVQNVSDYSTHSVAQHTYTVLLHILGRPNYFDEHIKSGAYSKQDIFTHIGPGFNELYGKKLGIIGMGNIGKQVAQIATGFGMDVCYYSTSGKNSFDKYPKLALNDLLSSSDVVSIHAPLNDNTRNLIGLKEIKLMKKTAILLNMGRGGIVVENDLAKALNDDIIYAAGLDVFEKEPIHPNNPLLQLKDKSKLVLTPHIAWASIEARNTLIDKTINNIKTYLKNRA